MTTPYHPTIHTNVHDVTSIHIHAKGKVWPQSQGDEHFDTVESSDIIIKMESGQQIKLTMFHNPGLVPTFSSVEQEAAEVVS